MYGVIEPGGVEGDADGDQGEHLVVLLGNGVVLGVFLEIFRSRNEDEDVRKHADSICVASHHHVRESDIVVGCEMSSHDSSKHGLLVQFNIVEGFERQAKVSEKAVDSEQTDNTKIA